METLYKVLGENGAPYHGGTGVWHLPTRTRPGKWMPPIEGDLIPCYNGYHVARLHQLIPWLGPHIYEVEVRGDMVEESGKLVVRQARLIRETAWNERAARLFAADCAEHVLHLYEQTYPTDARPRRAIETARRHANGAATDGEMAASGAASRAASRAASWAAAEFAAEAASWAATEFAAGAAAGAASWAASRAASRAAEHEWQTERLRQYLTGEVA